MEFGYFLFFKKHKYMGEYQCAYFSIILSKGLLENISRGLFLWQGTEKKSSQWDKQNTSDNLFSFEACFNELWPKNRKNSSKRTSSKRKVYKSPLISPKSGYSWQQMKFCYSSEKLTRRSKQHPLLFCLAQRLPCTGVLPVTNWIAPPQICMLKS